MMRKTKERIDELETKVDHLIERVDNLRDDIHGNRFKAMVASALQDVIDTHQAITIRHYLNDKEITTKLVKDELRALEQQQSDLECTLENVKETIKKYGK